MYKAIEIANYVIDRCYNQDNHKSITNLKLQKCLFHLQREYLIKHNEPLFEEDFEAWCYGPVVSNIYYEYCSSGAMPIWPGIYSPTVDKNKYVPNLDKTLQEFLNPIIDKYKDYDVWQMVEQIHGKEGAWYKAFHEKGNKAIIPIEWIKNMPVVEIN